MKINGITKIQLFSKDGQLEYEDIKKNMVTNYYKDYINFFKGEYPNVGSVRDFFSGILLFSTTFEQDPTKYTIDVDKYNNLTGKAKGVYLDTDSKTGTLNLEESEQLTNGYKFVWDFGLDKANGTVKSICLSKDIDLDPDNGNMIFSNLNDSKFLCFSKENDFFANTGDGYKRISIDRNYDLNLKNTYEDRISEYDFQSETIIGYDKDYIYTKINPLIITQYNKIDYSFKKQTQVNDSNTYPVVFADDNYIFRLESEFFYSKIYAYNYDGELIFNHILIGKVSGNMPIYGITSNLSSIGIVGKFKDGYIINGFDYSLILNENLEIIESFEKDPIQEYNYIDPNTPGGGERVVGWDYKRNMFLKKFLYNDGATYENYTNLTLPNYNLSTINNITTFQKTSNQTLKITYIVEMED